MMVRERRCKRYARNAPIQMLSIASRISPRTTAPVSDSDQTTSRQRPFLRILLAFLVIVVIVVIVWKLLLGHIEPEKDVRVIRAE